ncbi:hypothetical protein [Xenorhabdus szentirmaii]|uniref:Bacteriophage protein n=1 Tax=Xenorhabdus szentirmaii DSM 16338 TaxID=1427518 RepID=W1J3U9_9GAMM|nr:MULTISPECIES: hypothetical protein [Xenorhabdus]MBD2803507.1 hypothetical protein [Xenorhabdus sp. ZM]PHM32016.1 bacteriophage protein [Xenorhabdus szentirmaii DSM 16338]CDL85422.1 conserved hypothetical protein [Xenorhabdus szentirmaii DSM 16338]
MRYRREDNGDYSFGQGDNTFLIDSPEAVAQAVKTRLNLWSGDWFLDTAEGTPYREAVLEKNYASAMLLRERILDTKGVTEIVSLDASRDPDSRKIIITATINTRYGKATVTSKR